MEVVQAFLLTILLRQGEQVLVALVLLEEIVLAVHQLLQQQIEVEVLVEDTLILETVEMVDLEL